MRTKQASEVIPIINTLIDKITQLEILINTHNEDLIKVQEELNEFKNIWSDLKSILADVMDWTGFLDHLGLRRNKQNLDQ